MPKISFEQWPRERSVRGRCVVGAVLFLGLAAWLSAHPYFDPARARLQQPAFMLGEHNATKLHSLLLTSNSVEIANQGHLASTEAVPESLRRDGQPTISIVTEERNLYDKREGLLRHRLERGREWERPAFVSYFEAGNLRYEAPVGLRLHGGKSRKASVPSFQLVFRRSYAGAPRSPEGVFFGVVVSRTSASCWPVP